MATDTNWHTVVSTTLGELTLVRDADGLRGLYFPHHWYQPDPATFGPRSTDGFGAAAGQLTEYLTGQRREFDLPLNPQGDGFQLRVWGLIRQIPHGDTVTYGGLAGQLGGNVTAQQVGATVGRNPLCIVVPCHRVVGAAGKLTGYAGGLARKRHLLDLEQTGLPPLVLPGLSSAGTLNLL
ncbi:MAG: methylated-DNA-[protein]-cysteine S-methyltransferase [Pseudonocardiales bacterium]|jgi:methylated-DNA-[protein]-cysteine S-methyltransferase|nr:methylated-DNA-[protein]-cysteine S-methyltransferase [Pseudonocardiales bacterium]